MIGRGARVFILFLIVAAGSMASAAVKCDGALAGEVIILRELALMKNAIDDIQKTNPELARPLYRQYLAKYLAAKKMQFDVAKIPVLQAHERGTAIAESEIEAEKRKKAIEGELKIFMPYKLSGERQSSREWTSGKFSPDAKYLLYSDGHSDYPALYNAADMKGRTTLQVENITVTKFSPDSRSVLVGSEDLVRIFDIAKGRFISSIPYRGFVRTVASSPNGKWIAIAGVGPLVIADAQTGRVLTKVAVQSAEVDAISFSPDSHALAVAEHDGTISLWDMEKVWAAGNKWLSRWSKAEPTWRMHSATPNRKFSELNFSPDGLTLLATANELTAFDVRTGNQAWRKGYRELRRFDGQIFRTVFLPQGMGIALYGFYSGVLVIVSAETGEIVYQFPEKDAIVALNVSTETGRITTAIKNKIQYWDRETLEDQK